MDLTCFSATAFIRGTNCLIAFLIATMSSVEIFQGDFTLFFSSASDANGFSDLSL